MTVEAIKAAIEQLPPPVRRDLLVWLDELEERAWDEEIEKDCAPGGRGDSLAEGVRRNVAAGLARPLEEGFQKRRKRRA